MGGSSGSDNKQQQSNTKKADEPIPGTSPLMMQPAFIGDNQNMLAQQLAAGGYGSMPDLMAMLSQTFNPMQVLDTRPGAVAPPSTPAPTAPTTGGGGSSGNSARPSGGRGWEIFPQQIRNLVR